MHAKRISRKGSAGAAEPTREPGVLTVSRAIHMRLERELGKAREHECEAFGCLSTADEWAFTHWCSEERTELSRRYPTPWCTHLEHYMPMCRSHHRRFDAAHHRQLREWRDSERAA